eukprot:scaffold1010_cov334-Prasinococcus_capsulatus_cf.AAC.5
MKHRSTLSLATNGREHSCAYLRMLEVLSPSFVVKFSKMRCGYASDTLGSWPSPARMSCRVTTFTKPK